MPGIAPFLLADSLAMSQAQRLVRRLCSNCKRPTPITPQAAAIFYKNLVSLPSEGVTLFQPAGCPECNDTGYRGRIALMEMCAINFELSELIARNAPQTQLREVAQKSGLLSLYQEGLTQVLAGQTTLEEISCLTYTAIAD